MIYLFQNAAKNTTAPPTPIATGIATLKTLLQVKPIVPCKVIEWGISFDGSAVATPGTVELIEVDVAATVTAFVDADITQYDGEALGNLPSVYVTESTSGSGFTASVEGSITVVRNLDAPQQIAPTTQFVKQFPLGREPIIQAAKFARIRTKFAVSVDALCYMILSF